MTRSDVELAKEPFPANDNFQELEAEFVEGTGCEEPQIQRQQQEALQRVAQARERFETFDPASHKLALAEAVREAEDLAAALQTMTVAPPLSKKGK